MSAEEVRLLHVIDAKLDRQSAEIARLTAEYETTCVKLDVAQSETAKVRADWRMVAAIILEETRDADYHPRPSRLREILAIAERHMIKEGGDHDNPARSLDNATPAPDALGERATLELIRDRAAGTSADRWIDDSAAIHSLAFCAVIDWEKRTGKRLGRQAQPGTPETDADPHNPNAPAPSPVTGMEA